MHKPSFNNLRSFRLGLNLSHIDALNLQAGSFSTDSEFGDRRTEGQGHIPIRHGLRSKLRNAEFFKAFFGDAKKERGDGNKAES